MSADKKGDINLPTITVTGRLVLRTFGKHTKSEHLGVYLVADQFDYLIRPAGCNPFMDNPLLPLTGKMIIATGYIMDYVFMVQTWQEASE
ncbi:hypothetical protein [Chitinophaga nivalis]|uniref:Uncharacterized protein n=1 Tax=Chitinophaga nivalis TaxID=2991709 RepID=A0ABT3IR98_9BACT|nr:hypothetical protein [Chitinophaga nivalis]MCW3463832.1 hypothetical protein [Chitinophaga nivalis]MCW3486478.1 hypothetical protein [Chitinophaga nivalis]